MARWERRTVAYVGLFLSVLAVYVLAFHWGMAHLEDEPITIVDSLGFVVETFTTVGYGSIAAWSTPAMELLVVAMNLTGVILVFMALPLVVVPLFEEALSMSPPTSASKVTDHVVLCGFSGRGETLVEELTAWETDYVVVEPDRDRAVEFVESDVRVVHGDPQDADVLEAAGIHRSRAVVADADDETNASIVLAAREVAPDARVIAVAEEPDNTRYLEYAGADAVITPRHILGQSLAEKVTASVTTELGDSVELGEDLEVAELVVEPESEVAGKAIADSGIRERTGASVIGAWDRGTFVSQPSAEDVLEAGLILLVAGTPAQVERLRGLTGTSADRRHGLVIVAGYGEVGATVSAELASADVPYRVVDVAEKAGVDLVGDATDEATLRSAGVTSARAVILALPDDTTTAFATLVVRELAPEVEVVARADEAGANRKLYLAGADYVQSLGTVTGRMIASEVLDEEVFSPEKQVEIIKLRAPRFAGQSLREADIRGRTGCTVIAIQRNGDLLTDLGPDEVIQSDDELVLAGSDDSVTRFGALSR